MQAFPPKANSPICFPLFRTSVARHFSITSSILWLAFSLLAMVQLAGCGIAYNTLPLTVDPNSVSFGAVQVGKTQAATVTLHNQGLTAVTLSGMQVADPAFALSSDQANTTIAAGGSASLKVTFAPTAAKDYDSQVVIQSGDRKSAVAVSGTGQQPQSTPPPTSGSPAMQVSSTALQFGSVPIGGNAQQTLTLTSTGTAALDVSALSASGDGFSAKAPALPLSLQPGQSLTLPVTFVPTKAGAEAGKLVIGSDAVGSSYVAVSLVGNGTSSTPAPPDAPALTLSSTTVDFGSVAVGSQGSTSLTLTSSGTAAVVIQSLAVSGDAFATGKLKLPLTLAPGQQIAVPLTFAPLAGGAQQGEITLTDNATGSPSTISLTGTGTTSASFSAPASVEFGDVTVGSSGSKTITLVSNGSAPVTIKSIAVAGGSFFGPPMALPQVLRPNQQMAVKVKFSPSAEGDATGSITISSNSTTNASAKVPMHGKGTAAPAPSLSASATSLSFGQVAVGSKSTKSLTVTSTGTAPATISGGSVTGAGYTATYAGVPIAKLSAPLTLQPGQRVTFDLVFDPAKAGASNGKLSLATDTGSPVNVSLSGAGTNSSAPGLTLSDSSLNFGDVEMGSQAVHQLTLTSSGTAPVTISSATTAGQNFKISSATYPAGITGWPATLNPGQQVVLSIAFSPDAAASFSGNLALTSDASGGIANVPLSGTGDAVPAAGLTLSPTSISFGQVMVGSKSTKSLTLTSSGNAPLTISAITVSGAQFSDGTTSLPVTLQPNQQLTLTVTYEPTAEGSDSGTLTVASNDSSGPSTVSLGGSGTTAPSPQLTVNPTAVNFGDVPLNATPNKAVTVTSSGTAPVTITAANVTGPGFSVSGASFPLTLNPNQTATLQVQFNPSAAGAASGQLSITSDASGGTAKIPLSGTGDAVPAAGLTLSPTSISFGQVMVGSKSTKSLTLTSSGNAPLTISAITVSGAQFSDGTTSLPVTLQPNQQLTLTVTYEPTAEGSDSGTLTVASNDSSGPSTVSLGGSGTTAPSPQLTVNPTAVNFGDVPLNATSNKAVTVTSSGTAPVTITAANVTGRGFGVSGASFPLTLNPNQTATLQVQFNPSAAGAASGQLSITSDASGGTANVPLSGTGDAVPAADLTLSPTSISFGHVMVGSKSTKSLTLTSSGNAPLTISAITVSGAQFSDGTTSLPVTLQPNQQLTLTVTYEPTAEGSDSGTLTVASNDSSGPSTVSLGGSGTTAPSPQLTVNPTAVNFGDVPLNATSNKAVTVTSSGTAPVTITAANVTGRGFGVSGASFPLTLNPNQTATLQVQFNPSAAGAASGQLSITSDASGGTAKIPLNGTGTVSASAQLTVSANSLAFDNVAVNSTATLPVTLTSSGTAPVTVSSAAVSGTGFADSGATFPVTLNPNQSVTLNVQFNPKTTGQATGQLTINSNSSTGATSVVQLSGTGTSTATAQLQVSTTSLTFGDVPVNSTATLTLRLTSSGTAPVTVSSAALKGAGFSDSGVSFPVTLNPNQSATLNVQFDPTVAGAVTGQLSISSNSSSGATTQVQLSGTGTATQHEIDLSWDAPASSADPVAGYNIYRSTGSGGSFAKLNTSPNSPESYTDNAVQSGTTYVYEVKSVDASGLESSASNQITLSVP